MKRYLFSTKANLATQSGLKGLAQAHLVTAASCIVVITDDDQVAALLDKLDTAERIETAGDQVLAAARAIDKQPKGRKPRKPYSGPLVECPKCHEKKAPFSMTKAGICKVCHMRELKAAKSQTKEKSQGQWTSGMPQSDGHHEEYLAELQARPKKKIDLSKLSGVKVG